MSARQRKGTRDGAAAGRKPGSGERSSAGGGGMLARWRLRRRSLRESRMLLKETRRILRRYRVRIGHEPSELIAAEARALRTARAARDVPAMREHAERLDELLERHASFGRKSAPREYAESIGVAVVIALLLRAFVVEAFKIPSGSMIPTLKIGDHIFVNKFIYGLRVPFTDIKFFPQMPNRGDVVVFVYPVDDDKDFIKRIVAIGGDRIAVRNNVVYVNGKAVPRRRMEGECKYIDGDENSTGAQILPCIAYEERLNDNRYRVIQDLNSFPMDMSARQVPPGHVFVMGDNRDNSHDSRAWGTVPLANIKGKALIIWWSSGEPDGVRWRRFFDMVHAPPHGNQITP